MTATFDPFADAPTNTEMATDWPEPNTEKTEETKDMTNESQETQTVQENTGEISVTLKGGSGFDAPWIVVRDSDPAQVLETLKNNSMGELVQWAAKVGHHFAGKVTELKPEAKPTPQNTSAPAQSASQAPAQQSGSGQQCEHGEMTFREGVSKKGNAYKGYFCPAQDRNAQCKPHFLS